MGNSTKYTLFDAAKKLLLSLRLKLIEPPVATLARGLADKHGNLVLEADALKPFKPRVVAIPFASSVTVNTDVTDLANLATMTGAQTIAFGGTPTDGQTVKTHHQQDAIGGRVLTPDPATAYFGTIGVTAANLPTAANAEWTMAWMFIGSVGKFKAVGIA